MVLREVPLFGSVKPRAVPRLPRAHAICLPFHLNDESSFLDGFEFNVPPQLKVAMVGMINFLKNFD